MVDKSEKFSWLVRIGYASRGLVYILLGYLALSTSNLAGGGAEAALDVVQDVPMGSPLLYVIAVGLLAYAAFKFISAVGDVEHHGSDAKGVATRIGYFASAIAHTLLSWTAFRFAQRDKQSAGQDDTGQQAATTLLSWEIGTLLVGLVGVGFLIGAAMQARSAVNAHFMRNLSGASDVICWIGRIGHAARAVVFVLIGWSLVRAAWLDSGTEVKGLGDALLSLRDNGTLYTIVAIGLLLFGVFSLIVARFRIIPDVDRDDLKPRLRR